MQKIISVLGTSFFSVVCALVSMAQFTQADTIRGTYGASRSWWDVTHYKINVQIDIDKKYISGSNIISFRTIAKGDMMQIDLQSPMIIDSLTIVPAADAKITSIKKTTILPFQMTRKGNGYFFSTKNLVETNSAYRLQIFYHGNPKVATNPPWDGGFIWKKDSKGNPWVSVACQGLGASVWYPCKDHQLDEPDSASLEITVPENLVVVGNGKCTDRKFYDSTLTNYTWSVKNPINSYNIVPYIGKYTNFSETYQAEKGPLSMNYWVIEGNEEKAKIQFKDATRMMKAFEHWFGPYPFYEDGYKLVESPHLGMEHQSAIAYGNKFQQGYSGKDFSATGWGLKFDFIIVHESGHEWFANNISSKDIADMWIHESFTNYSETLFLDYHYGKDAGNAYIQGTRQVILNDIAIIGTYNVNKQGSSDMYCKGANMIHMIRQVINNDEKFRQLLRGMNSDFYHQTVTTKQIEDYISKKSGINFQPLFDQYLRDIKIPILEIKTIVPGRKYECRFTNCNKDFTLPLKIKGTDTWIKPTTKWCELKLEIAEVKIDENFYIDTKVL